MHAISRRSCLAGLTTAASLPFAAAAQERTAQERTGANAPLIMGPDPDTKAPAYQAAAGAVDTHTHIFGPNATYPYWEKRSYTPPDAGLDLFRALHAKIGIERTVLVNVTVHGPDNRRFGFKA